MKSRILQIIAVLGALFLIPSFCFAKSVPAFSIEKMQLNGDYTVQVYSDGKWIDAGKLSFGKHYSDKTTDIGKIIGSSSQLPVAGSQEKTKGTVPPASGGLSPTQVIRIRLVQKGGGAAHIDSVFLGGSAPIKIGEAKDEKFLLKKLAKKDFDVIDAFGKTIELEFPANDGNTTLKLTARVEATEISKTPFHFPLSNLFKQMTSDSKFYPYKLEPSVSSQISPVPPFTNLSAHQFTNSPFFKEYFPSGSGHPSGFTYGWVRNDDENLYVKIDFTGDNTMDGDKDYAKVYVKTDSGLKEFKVSVPETKWGTPSFKYTDKVAYQHKVYDFKIPLSEILTQKSEVRSQKSEDIAQNKLKTQNPAGAENIQLAFAAYGTCSAGSSGDYDVQKNRFLIVYSKNYDIYGRQINSDGTAETEFLIATGSGDDQTFPSVAYDSVNKLFFVVWQEYDGSTYNIYGQLLDTNGQLITRTGTTGSDKFVISSASGDQNYPSVDYDSANHKFLVVWADFRNATWDIYGQFLNFDGSTDGGNFVISDNASSQMKPAVAYDSIKHRFLTVWKDNRLGDYDIYGQFINVTAAGSLYLEKKDGTPGAENFSVISVSAQNEVDPSVAYDNVNERFLVVWERNSDIYGRLVNANDGSTGSDIVVSNAAGSQDNPASVFDFVNRKFLVVWQDPRNSPFDVYGQFIYADGTLVDRDGNGTADPAGDNFHIVTSTYDNMHPSVAFNSNYTNFIVAYESACQGTGFSLVGPPALIPVAGQSICYDAAGKVISCSNTGQDGEMQAGVAWPSPRFTDNVDGTITDKLTGRMWARDAGVPACSGFPAGTQTWQNAIEHVSCINSFNSYGHNDWRLPNINELASIANYGEKNVFSWLGGQGFLNMQSGYWSSTTNEGNPSVAWTLGDSAGTLNAAVKTIANAFYVLPVRDSGQNGIISLPKTGQTFSHTANEQDDDGWFEMGVAWPDPRFTATGDCITDNLTGLTWVKSPDNITRTWANALTYSNGLDLCGFDDWRLPNNLELRGLINYGDDVSSIWLNGQGFSGVQGNYYWSSVSRGSSTGEAWAVNMTDGTVFSYSKANSRYVWPVRGGAMEYPVMSDVYVTMSGTPGPVSSGTDVNYVLTLTNNGPGIARSVFLADTLPGGAAYVSSTPVGVCENSGLSVNCGLGNMEPAASIVLNVNATLNTAGSNNNAATVFLSNDSDPANNSPFWAITVVATQHSLTVEKSGAGNGTVTTPLPGINCGADCSEVYASGTVVTLIAAPGAGSVFTGWTGCESPSGNQCFVTMDRAESVTANFNLNGYVTPSTGTGGSISPNTSQTVAHGATVSFIVTPDPGYHIASVTGCGGLLSVSIYTTGPFTADCAVSATFELNTYALTVSKAGTGSGTVTGPGPYSPGSVASVTASADANSAFTGWGGDCTDKSNPATLIMDGTKTCTANFVFSYYLLTINKTGDGTITLSPPGLSCTGTSGGDCYKYNKGQKVTLIASPGKNYIFKGWSSCSGTRPCQVTLDADKGVTASFEAVLPKISISSGGIDLVPGTDNYLEFDKVRVGRLKTKTLKVTNSGNGNLIISGQVEGADMGMFSRKMGGKVTIKPGKSYNIRVTFKPGSADEKSAELVINSNDPNMPSFKIELGGKGFIRKK